MAKNDKKLSISDMAFACLRPVDINGYAANISWRLVSGSICVFDSRQSTNNPHCHQNGYEICLVVDGDGEYRHGADRCRLATGSLFVADPGVVHEISSPSEHLVLAFFLFYPLGEVDGGDEGEAAAEAAVLASFLEGHAVWRSACHDLLPYVELLRRPRQHGVGDDILWRAFLHECLARLAYGVPAGGKRAAGDKLDTPVSRALAFIASRAIKGATVEEVAAAADVSPRHLARLFKDSLGCRPIERLADERLTAAAHLLAMRFSIAEVAERLGFSSAAQFSRQFRRRVGVPPKQFQSKRSPSRPWPATRPSPLPPPILAARKARNKKTPPSGVWTKKQTEN